MKKLLSLLVLALLVGLLPAAAGAHWAPSREVSVPNPDVLLLHADDDSPGNSPIQAILQAYGDLGAVELYGARTSTPTLAQLLAYDVVLTWSRDYYHDPVAVGDVLADYVDAGGRVINLNYSMGPPAQQMAGRFMAEGYTAMDGGLVYFGSTCLGSYNPDDPIMAGVTQVCDSVPLADTYLTPGSHEVARWAGDLLFVAAKDNQTVVSIAGYVGLVYQWTGQMPDVVHNAILWLTASQTDELYIKRMKMNQMQARPGRWLVSTQVRIFGTPLPPHGIEGATVYGEWTFPDGSVYPQTAVLPTDTLGRARFRVKGTQCGIYQLCVTDITKAGYVYEPAMNGDGPCKTVSVPCE